MPAGKIRLKFLTKNLVVKKKFDCRTIIRQDIEKLRFSTSYEQGSTGISYLSAPELNPEDNILIVDNSFEIENNSLEEGLEFIKLEDTFSTTRSNFIVTDVFIGDDPQFFWHSMPISHDFTHLQLLNEDLTIVDPGSWVYFDETERLGTPRRGIYTNLQCSLDKKERKYEVFYVRYRRSDTKEIVTHLLDASPFYSESSFTSSRNERRFVKTQSVGRTDVQMVFDSINYSPTPQAGRQRYMIRVNPDSVISIEKPAAFSPSERWYLRITPGDISVGERRYWVPEFYRQLFNPIYPFKKAQSKRATKIKGDLLYTDLFPIANLGVKGFYIEILVKDSFGGIVQAITDDPGAQTYITEAGALTDIVYEKGMIESIGAQTGIIKLTKPLLAGDVFLNYKYVEKFFTYNQLIVNPSINPDIMGKKILLYCKPNARDKSIEHLIVLEDGLIESSSKDDLFVTVNSVVESGGRDYFVDSTLSPYGDCYSGFELEILSGSNSGEKVKIASYDAVTNRVGLSSPLDNVLAAETIYRINKYFHSYSSRSIALGITYSYTGWEDYAVSESEHVLGDTYVIQKIVEDDISTYDVRIRGGGVKESRAFDASTLQNESQWYWDTGRWDGNAYPGMGALLIELPRDVLKEMGGAFDRDQIEGIVTKHMGSGSYPLIKYYDKSTEITDITTGSEYVDVEWRSVSATKYNIYLGNSSDNLTLLRSEPGTRYKTRIEGLENNKTYYIQLESVVGGIERLRSRTIAFVPYSFVELAPAIKYSVDKSRYLEGTYD